MERQTFSRPSYAAACNTVEPIADFVFTSVKSGRARIAKQTSEYFLSIAKRNGVANEVTPPCEALMPGQPRGVVANNRRHSATFELSMALMSDRLSGISSCGFEELVWPLSLWASSTSKRARPASLRWHDTCRTRTFGTKFRLVNRRPVMGDVLPCKSQRSMASRS